MQKNNPVEVSEFTNLHNLRFDIFQDDPALPVHRIATLREWEIDLGDNTRQEFTADGCQPDGLFSCIAERLSGQTLVRGNERIEVPQLIHTKTFNR